MAFHTIFGKAFVTGVDRMTLDSDLQTIIEYIAEVLERERRLEEERKATEAREAARKAEEARLTAIGKAEEEEATEKQRKKPQTGKLSTGGGFKYSLVSPNRLDDTGFFSLDDGYSEIDEFGFNSPYGIDAILSDPAISRGIGVDMTYCEKMRQLMQKYGMKSADVYKAANVDKTLFSRIYNNKNYKPSKDTAVSIALGLKLSLEETEDFIRRAGHTLTHSDRRDIVLECCFKKKIYNVVEVNIILDQLGYKPLSRTGC